MTSGRVYGVESGLYRVAGAQRGLYSGNINFIGNYIYGTRRSGTNSLLPAAYAQTRFFLFQEQSHGRFHGGVL